MNENVAFIRLLYLTQLGRIALLIRAMPELQILIKGMWVAMRSVFFTCCLEAMLLYVFSLILQALSRDTKFGEMYFPTVPKGEWTLLIHLTFFSGLGDFLENARQESAILMVVSIIGLMCMGSLVFMCIGVLLEVVHMVCMKEKDIFVRNWLVSSSKQILITTLGEQCVSSGMCRGHIDILFANQQFLQLLTGWFKQASFFSTSSLGLDLVDLKEVACMQYELGKTVVTHKELMGMVVELTGPNAAITRSMLRLRQTMPKRSL